MPLPVDRRSRSFASQTEGALALARLGVITWCKINLVVTPFRIDATTDPARPVVEVAGQSVGHLLRRVSVDLRPDQLPTLYMEANVEGSIDAEGLIVELIPCGHDPNEDVTRFLEAIDPDLLEKVVLNRAEWGAGNAMQITLDVLREWANGDTTRP